MDEDSLDKNPFKDNIEEWKKILREYIRTSTILSKNRGFPGHVRDNYAKKAELYKKELASL